MERKKCKEDGKACWVKEQFLSLWPHPGKGEERRDSLKKKTEGDCERSFK